MRKFFQILILSMATVAPGIVMSGAPTELVGDWRIKSIGQTPTLAGSNAVLVFTEDGTLSANVGCNQAGGSYRLDASGLDIGPLAATRKMCEQEIMAQEDAFFAAIEQTSEFRVDGNTLELLDESGSILLTARR